MTDDVLKGPGERLQGSGRNLVRADLIWLGAVVLASEESARVLLGGWGG